jgi:RecA-family ATPase
MTIRDETFGQPKRQSAPAILEPDRNQIEQFVDALFRHRGNEGYVSIRSFFDDEISSKPFRIEAVPVTAGFKYLVDVAEDHARRAANEPKRIVFCPPLAVFSNKDHAAEKDLLAGLALSIECDQEPEQARAELERILGPATVVVRSGGQWEPPGGLPRDKLHIHFRLARPASGAELVKLKRARRLAMRLVGGDASNVPVVHPIRWPGSWHRKRTPRLCEIEAIEPDREIDLDAAVAALEAALSGKDGNGFDHDAGPQQYGHDGNNDHERPDWAALAADILAGKNLHESTMRLAASYIGSGMKPEHALRQLQALMLATTAPHDERWQARFADLGRLVDDAKAKYGADQAGDKEPKREPLPFINIAAWDDEPVPQQDWAVPDRIPLRQCALFSGEGASGKSTIQLHLSAAHVLGKDWLGSLPEPGPAMFIDAEDDQNVIHRRLAAVANLFQVTFKELAAAGLHMISLAGKDAVLATVGRNGKIEPTQLYRQILEAAHAIKPKIIGIASSANVFAGSEIDRSQVQQFVSLLTAVAIAANGSVVLISHPSLEGIKSDTGLSGSTQWHNSVRARFYLKGIKPDDGDEPDSDIRELVFRKNNYGPVSANIVLRYRNGLFLPEHSISGLDKLARESKSDELFLDLLKRFAGEGRNLSHNASSRTYAPTVFATDTEAKQHRLRKADLEAAMNRLFKAKKIYVENYGRPSRPYSRIAIKD